MGAESKLVSLGVLILLSVVIAMGPLTRGRFSFPIYFRYLWTIVLLLFLAEWVSFTLAIWLFALLSFVALREFLSLVDIRLQDRWGILGAYAAIPFMTAFIQTNWYGMFIISIPVYAFTVIPLLVAMGGGDPEGTVFSLGVIDLGLFVFVYCMGHIAYLAFFSAPLALFFIASAAYCDLVYRKLPTENRLANLGAAVVGTIAILLFSSRWTGLPIVHAVGLGLVIPLLGLGGSFTLRMVEDDLRVRRGELEPGRGLLLDSLKGYLIPAPIVFHYLRWFLHWGDL